MARHRGDGASHSYLDDAYPPIHTDPERRHRRRHRHRESADDDYLAHRDRDRRREPDADLNDLRARQPTYYVDSDRHRDPERMAQAPRPESTKSKPRSSHRELHRDGTRKKKKRDPIPDDRSDDYAYSRPKSRAPVEEITVRTSSVRKRSDEGASSSRTAYTPRSGSGSASVRRVETTSLGRSASAREPSRTFLSTRPLHRASPSKLPSPANPTVSRSFSAREPPRRNAGGLLSSFFRPSQRSPPAAAAPRVDCLVCMNDDLPLSKTAKLACGHRMCHSCLKRQFTLSVQDPQHMPPRCCTQDHIPLKYAERLFDDKFKTLWNKKYQEYTTENRLYCPARGCGEWIKPSKIRVDLTTKRKYARCSRCDTKVCVLCNSKFHSRRECPKDEETNRVVQMAKEKGWQRCYSCKAVVELKEGCNHMTCRCTAQFCMVCALPWKTCNCPWFNYEHIEDGDRLNDMRVPYTTSRHPDVEVIEVTQEPPMVRRSSTRTRHRSGRDREHERADSALAAHLQSQLHLDPITPTTSDRFRTEPAIQVYGVGNSGGHHMNDSYMVRPVITSAAHAPVRVPAPRQTYSGSRRVVREAPAPVYAPPAVAASAMAGLSSDGTKRGENRVGTWLNHVQIDPEAINTQERGVEVDDWRCDGTMIGID